MASDGVLGRLRQAVGARPGEGAVLVASSAYYFLVLCAYYVIRPIRDDMGAAGGVENLAWLFLGTLTGMLLLHPVYTKLVSSLTRARFIAWTYRFFILNLVLFFVAFRMVGLEQSVWVGRIFFIWVSVFNLFVVSVFWSLITDVFRPGQGKRLFGIVAVGGTIGAIFGSSLTTALVDTLGSVNLLLVSAAILELAVQASHFLDRREEAMRVAEAADAAHAVAEVSQPTGSKEVIGGGIMDGIRHVLSSPYLLGIAFLILFYSVTSTFLYFQQVDVVERLFGDDRAARTRVFASFDLAVNILTLITQLFLTGRLMRWFGVGFGIAFLPIVTLVGFGLMSVSPVLAVLAVFYVVRRAANFAIQRPAREALYTVLQRTDKYKAKNFSDTFVYRVGDQAGAWAYSGLAAIGLGVAQLAVVMVPVSALWLVLTVWLGRQFKAREARQDPATRVGLEPTS